MSWALLSTLLFFVLLVGWHVLKMPYPTSLQAYLSFSPDQQLKHLRGTFEASNLTFNTSFAVMFLYAFSLGLMTIWIALGFVLGILVYARWLLPRHLQVIAQDIRLPQFLSQISQQRWIRLWAACLLVSIFGVYYYVELLGFHLFLEQTFVQTPGFALGLKLLLSLGLMGYMVRGGFQNVVQTDWLQLGCIRLGTLALYLMVFMLIGLHWQDLFSRPWPLTSFFAQPGFIVQTLAGFLFGQLLYYENWLRLSLYFESHRDNVAEWLPLYQRLLYRSALSTLLILLGPVCLGLVAAHLGLVEPGPLGLFQVLQQLWQSHLIFAFCICLLFLQLLGALLSTLDTFCISSVALILEDILKIPLKTSQAHALRTARWLAAGFVTVGFVCSFWVVNMELAFIYLVYSVNGFVGPLLWGLFVPERPLPAWGVALALLSGFVLPLWALLVNSAWLFEYSGLLNLLISCGLTLLLAGFAQPTKALRIE